VPNYNDDMVKSTKKKLSASLEDYLEAIFNLSDGEGHAHCTDIANVLNVAKPSVTGALHTLKKKGLANYEPYGSVTLTAKGKKAAEKVAAKHRIIKSFFVNVLGIDSDTAADAACKAEHAFGPEVVSRLLTFSEYINKNGKSGKEFIKEFKKVCDKQKLK
jgi:DtxR family Mn-dependent transcriptional regulator